jgi:hypothetical protein
MGFEMLHGDVVIDGVPVWFDYAGTGVHRVVFRREITATGSPERPDDLADRVGPSRDDLDRALAP